MTILQQEVSRSIRSSELRKLKGARREKALEKLAKGTRNAPNGEVWDASEIIAVYEKSHGYTSDEMRRRLEAGELEESWEICQWLLQLRRREESVRTWKQRDGWASGIGASTQP